MLLIISKALGFCFWLIFIGLSNYHGGKRSFVGVRIERWYIISISILGFGLGFFWFFEYDAPPINLIAGFVAGFVFGLITFFDVILSYAFGCLLRRNLIGNLHIKYKKRFL